MFVAARWGCGGQGGVVIGVRAMRQSITDVRRVWGGLLVGLLAIDALFLILHVGRVRFDLPAGDRWLISFDRGYAEIFQYLKLLVIVSLLGRLVLDRRMALYLGWSMLFLYFLFDDSLELHERAGDWLADVLGGASIGPIEGRDVGQVLVALAVLVVVGGVILAMWPPAGSPDARFSIGLGALVGLLGFFGVVVDAIDGLDLFSITEDGGEMAVVSLIVAYVAVVGRDVGVRPLWSQAG